MLRQRFLAVVLSLLAGAVGARGQEFRVAQQYAAGANPWSVVTADFNGDGIPDLAVANYSDNTVSIMFGNGDGTFQTQVTYATGIEPISLAVGDFNSDGKPDLAVVCLYDDAVAIMINGAGGAAAGTFPSWVEYSTEAQGGKNVGPYSVAVGAFVTGSSILDLAVANSANNTVSILIGNGDGTFGHPTQYATGTEPTSVAVGNLNGDTKPDLVVANFGGSSVSVLIGNGDGTFQTHVDYATGNEPISVAIGYFNGSGSPADVATANNFASTVSVLAGNGDGTLQTHVDYATGSEPSFVAVGDVNGDGNPDLVVADEGGGSVSVLLGVAGGSFQPHADFGAGISPRSVAFGNFNGGNNLDIAVANTNSVSDSVSILLGFGNGSFQDSDVFVTGIEPFGAAAGDFNGDGIPDFVTLGSAPSGTCGGQAGELAPCLTVLLGNGDGTFQAPIETQLSSLPYAVAVGDFNGDHILDLAVVNVGADTVSVLLGNGNGTFQAPVSYATGSEPVAVAVGQLVTGSKNLDLIVANLASNTVSVLVGNGDGTFQTHVDYSTGSGSGPHSVAVGSFTSDGNQDVAVANSLSDTVSVLLGNGDGTLQSHVDYATGSEPVAVAVGTFNNDGNLDVVTANALSNNLSLLLGNGTGTLGAPTSFTTGAAPHSVVVTDFNGDGYADVATANVVDNTVSVMLGTGAGSFQPGTNYPAGPSPYIAVAADFNLDGAPDLAAADNAGSDATVILNTRGTSLTLTSSPNPSSPGGAVQFTATIAPGVTMFGQAAPTGSISFYNGATLLGSGTIASGSVSVSNSSLPTGNDSITAVYSGDANFNPHTSAPFIQMVGSTFLSVSPTSLTFPVQLAGTTSSAQNVTLSNTGTSAVSITKISVTTYFEYTSTCPLSPSTLAAGANCTISVKFFPKAVGTLTGTLSITDNAPGSPQTVSLTGTATQVQVSPTSLNFGSVAVGNSSSPMTVTLTNASNTLSLSITSIAVTGTDPVDFPETNDCGSSLGAKQSCTITVTFTPATTGSLSATLSISDNGGASPQTVSLTGMGTGTPTASLSPTSLTFATQLDGTTSAAQGVTLTNTGTAPLTISNIQASTPFGIKNNTCGSSLAAGANCSIGVNFTPKTTGTITGTLSVTDNAAGSPQTVSLTGVGTVVKLSPTSLNFGTVTVGTTSPQMTVTLTNGSKTSSLSITSITIAGTDPTDFAQTNNCPVSGSLGTQQSCTINVTFTPPSNASFSASLSISDNGGGSPQTVGLQGSGTGGSSTVSLSPTSLTFPTQLEQTTSAPQNVTLTNGTGSAITITSILASTNFGVKGNTCPTSPSTLAAGGSCTISVTFTPTATGTLTGTLSVTDNGPGSPQTASLTGTGTVVKLSPTSLSFGTVSVGTTSPAMTVTLTNGSKSSTLNITSVTITGADPGDFAVPSTTCGGLLGTQKTCTINVTFTPATTGSRSASVSISDNGGGSPQMVGLQGTGD